MGQAVGGVISAAVQTGVWLHHVEVTVSRPLADILVEDRHLASFYLYLATQTCIDLAARWIAKAGWPLPDDAGSAFDLLAAHGAIGKDLVRPLRNAVGLRAHISHGEALLNSDPVHAEFREGVAALRQFLALAGAESAH